MQPPQVCKAQLVDKRILNSKFIHYYFEFTQPASIPFAPGQYTSIKVSEHGDRRSYSICSSPEKNHGFELLVDKDPDGLGVKYLDNLLPGQEMEALFPMGVFTVANDPAEEALVFVATGSGIAPFRSMILDQLQERKNTQPIWLYWGLRHLEWLFWQDEFQELAEQFPNFHFHPVLSQAVDEWPLCRGRVTDCLSIHELPPKAGYYVCGNQTMIKDVMTLLPTRGVEPTHIHHEKFY